MHFKAQVLEQQLAIWALTAEVMHRSNKLPALTTALMLTELQLY